MNQKQIALSGIPEVPPWWAWLLPKFAGQPWLNLRAKVTNTEFHPATSFRMGGMVSIPVYINQSFWLKVETPHGDAMVEVTEPHFRLVKIGDTICIKYRLSRQYARNQRIDATLI